MPDKLTVVCAWCRRVKQKDGSFKKARTPANATHTICPDCHIAVQRELDKRAERVYLVK